MPVRMKVGGGGGGGGGTVNVGPWGPDFGESAGSDGVTNEATTTQLPLTDVAVVNTKIIDGTVDLDALALVNDHSLDASMDLATLALVNDSALDGTVDFDALAVSNDSSLDGTVTLPAVATNGELPADVDIYGKVVGPPQYMSVASNTGAALGGTSVSCNVPSGVEAGDLLVADVAAGPQQTSPTTADQSGWTLGHTTSLNAQNSGARFWWRVATASEPASYSFTFTMAVTNVGFGTVAIHRIKGANNTAPFDDVASSVGLTSSSTMAIPSATSTVANTLRMAFHWVYNNLNTTQPNYSYTPPAGFVERYDIGQATLAIPPNEDAAQATRVLPTIGASGNANMTLSPTPTFNVQRIGCQILIAPDPAGIPIGNTP